MDMQGSLKTSMGIPYYRSFLRVHVDQLNRKLDKIVSTYRTRETHAKGFSNGCEEAASSKNGFLKASISFCFTRAQGVQH